MALYRTSVAEMAGDLVGPRRSTLPLVPALLMMLSLMLASCSAGIPGSSLESSQSGGEQLVGPSTSMAPSVVPSPTSASGPDPAAERSVEAGDFVSSNPGGGGAFSSGAIGSDGLLVVGSDLSGAYISLDDGETWAAAGSANGLAATHVSAVVLDPSRRVLNAGCDAIVLGTDAGVWESNDCGAFFQAASEVGYVTALAVGDGGDDSGHAIRYAAMSSDFDQADSRLYRSMDGGWFEDLDAVLPSGFLVIELRVDPADKKHLLAIGGAGRFAVGPSELLESNDSGVSWVQLAPELGPVVDARFGLDSSVFVSALGPGESKSGDNAGIHRLAAGEPGWTRLLGQAGVIWVSRSERGHVRVIDVESQYPWDDNQGIWESEDFGETWRNTALVENWEPGWSSADWVFGPPFEGPTKTLSFDANDPDRALWVNSQFVYATSDGGQHFEPLFTTEISQEAWLSTGIDNVVVADIEVAKADPDAWLVGYWDLGCFRSLDAGASWHNCNDYVLSGEWNGAGGFMPTVLTDPERPGVVWAALGQDWESEVNLVRSDDLAKSWALAADGTAGVNVLGMSLDPTSRSGQRHLFVTIDGDVFGSEDDGDTWSPVFECGGCSTTLVTADGIVLAAGEAGMWRSADGGQTWSVAGGLPSVIRGVGPPWSYGWTGVSSLVEGLTGSSSADLVLYATVFGPTGSAQGANDDAGVYRSDDAGETWRQIYATSFARTISVEPSTGVVWLGTSSAYEAGGFDEASIGLAQSTDGGQTWQTIDVGLPYPFVSEVVALEGELVMSSPGVGVGVVAYSTR